MSTTQTHQVAVTIAHWNGRDMLEPCLASLMKQSHPATEIIIVDNGSTDGSVEWIRATYPEITLLTIDMNTGFAVAHNIAITYALKNSAITHVLTLNNDTELDPDFIQNLVTASTAHPEAGSIQGKIYNFTDRTLIDCVGVLIHPDMSGFNRGQKTHDSGQYSTAEWIFGPSASAALYTRAAIEKISLPTSVHTLDFADHIPESLRFEKDFFDSIYFAYYEDVDVAWRMQLAGFTSWFTPDAIAYHIHSATGVNASPFKAFHIHRNHYFNIIKDLPFWLMLRALALMPIRYVLQLTSVLAGRGAAARLKNTTSQKTESQSIASIVLGSWKQVIQHLPFLLRRRRAIQNMRVVNTRTVTRWMKIYRVSWKDIIFQ